MNIFKCPICTAHSFVRKAKYRACTEIFTNRDIIQCRSCQTMMVNPLPDKRQLDLYYHYYWKKETLTELLPLFEAQAAARIEFFKPLMPRGEKLSVLDIGAGFGLIYKVLSTVSGQDIRYDAVEMDPLAVDYLRTFIKPRVIFDRPEDIQGKYHVILLSHIIEHLTDPVLFLTNLSDLLHDEGILFIEVPNQDHKFKSLNEPHLFFFDEKTLSNIVVQSGYNVLRVDICGPQIAELQGNGRIALAIKNVLRRNVPHPIKTVLLRMRRIINNKPSLAGIPKEAIYDYNPWGRWIRVVALKKSRHT